MSIFSSSSATRETDPTQRAGALPSDKSSRSPAHGSRWVWQTLRARKVAVRAPPRGASLWYAQCTATGRAMGIRPRIELDISSLSIDECTPHVLAVFDQLSPEEALVLRSTSEPAAVLHALQSERKDLFDWHLLESGPEDYLIEICCLRDVGRRTVNDLMDHDHRRLERLLSELEWQAKQRMFHHAVDRLRHLRVGLSRHIQFEERVLYPEYRRLQGAGAGLVHSLESEHSIQLRLLMEVEEALISRNAESARLAVSDLRDILVPHAGNESR